jgi:hypothetical protein
MVANEIAGQPARQYSSIARCLFYGTLGVFRFELRRSLLPSRLIGWLFLAAFPAILLGITYLQIHDVIEKEEIPRVNLNFGYSLAMFLLIPQVVTVLGLLLWATPIVNAELEAQSWIYSVVRPVGKVSTVLGKYLVAVLWTSSAGIAAATASVSFTLVDDRIQLWWTIVRLVVLATLTYGALYVLIGTLFQRRSMVVAFVYTLIVEVALSYVPASLNKFTVGYRLKSLMAIWQDIKLDAVLGDSNFFVDTSGQWHHYLALAAYGFILLGIGLARVWQGEYPLQPEAG